MKCSAPVDLRLPHCICRSCYRSLRHKAMAERQGLQAPTAFWSPLQHSVGVLHLEPKPATVSYLRRLRLFSLSYGLRGWCPVERYPMYHEVFEFLSFAKSSSFTTRIFARSSLAPEASRREMRATHWAANAKKGKQAYCGILHSSTHFVSKCGKIHKYPMFVSKSFQSVSVHTVNFACVAVRFEPRAVLLFSRFLTKLREFRTRQVLCFFHILSGSFENIGAHLIPSGERLNVCHEARQQSRHPAKDFEKKQNPSKSIFCVFYEGLRLQLPS